MKKKNIILNDNGFALITTLLLGLISLALITMAFYMVASSARLGGVNKRYTVELDTAKGVSGYVMSQILGGGLLCGAAPGTNCVPGTNDQILIDSNICTALNKPGCAGVSATFLSNDSFLDPITPSGTTYAPRYSFYSARITSVNNIGEQAILDFVYKVTD